MARPGKGTLRPRTHPSRTGYGLMLLRKDLRELQAKYDALQKSHKKLMKYAQHKDDCSIWTYTGIKKVACVTRKCNCGFEQAIAEAEKIRLPGSTDETSKY